MTRKISRFLAQRRPETPCLVLDLDIVAQNYAKLRQAMPDAEIFYAMKANPAAEVLALLVRLGSSFDAASINEIDLVLAATRAVPERWRGGRGRIVSSQLRPLIDAPDTLCFVCGPAAMVDDVPRMLLELGIDRSRIRLEEW